MKKSIKIISVLMMAVMLIMIATPVFATTIDAANVIDGIQPQNPSETGSLLTIFGKVLGIIRWVAIAGGTLIIAVLGIKYMMGSLEEKADYKKSMVPLIVGTVVVMGATSIAKVLFDVFTT